MTRHCAVCAPASSILREMYLAVAGPIAPSILMNETFSAADATAHVTARSQVAAAIFIASLECVHRRAGTKQIPIAINIVAPGDGGPEFVLARPRRREGGLFARVGAVPFCRRESPDRVRRILERIVLLVDLAACDRLDFRANGNHRVAKPVEFVL